MEDKTVLNAEKPLNSVLTLVLSSHNRPGYLRRAVNFYSRLGCKVLVLDSSSQALASKEITLPMVDYRHMPQHADGDLTAKLSAVLDSVDTPYTVLVPDNDFIVHTSLRKVVSFLEANPDYSMCQGYSLMYACKGNRVDYLRRDKKVREDYADEKAQDRIVSYMSQYLPLLNAVIRTPLLGEFFRSLPTGNAEWLEISHAWYVLACGKARILPCPYAVRELDTGNVETRSDIYHKLSYLDPKTVAERSAYAESLASLTAEWVTTDLDAGKQFALESFEVMAQGLRDRTSLTVEPIFHSTWAEPLSEPERTFEPRQYVEMPFYNQAFFDTLTESEFLLHAMPANYEQLSELEGIWVRQRALMLIHDNDVPETILNRLWEAVALSPFNREVVNALTHQLELQCSAGVDGLELDTKMMKDWTRRLNAAPAFDYRKVFEGMRSGQVLQWLENRSPDAAQGVALQNSLSQAGGGPLFGLFLLDLDDDMNRVQTTLDSLVEGYSKRFRIVVFTTGEPPAATVVNNVLHFVKVTRANYVDKLNQMSRQTLCDWVMVAEVGDVFTPAGLLRAGLELKDASECRAVSVDEIQRQEGHELVDLFRSGFNLDLLQSVPSQMSRHWLVRRDVLLAAGGYSADYVDALEFELLLRIIETGGMDGLAHLNEPLLICAAQPLKENEQERQALSRHLTARGYKALITSSRPGTYQIDYRHTERPLVSVIVHGEHDLLTLQRCLNSVLQRTRYANYEVMVAATPQCEAPLREWVDSQHTAGVRVQVIGNSDGLDQSALINAMAAQTNGDYIVLLAGDAQVISPNWIGSFMNQALRPEVGAVGSKLINEQGHVTQGGLLLGFDGGIGSPFVGRPKDEAGYLLRNVVEQNHSALSGICMMVRREVFEHVGAMDENVFAQAFADIDLSLKIASTGLLLVWTPQVQIIHSGSLPDAPEILAALQDKWSQVFALDPAYNASLALEGEAYSLGHSGGSHWQEFLD